MFKLSKAQANLYALITFVLTILMSYYLPEHSITYTGFLLVIFLSVFVNDKKSTIIAAVTASLIVLAFLFFHPYIDRDAVNVTKHIFVLVLIFFTALIVLHIKKLYSDMSYDKSHMTSLFENATEGIILTNSAGTIVLANPAALRIFEYKQEELVGQKIEILLPKRYRSGHVQLRDGFYHAPGNRTMGSGRDLYGQKKNGENFPVEVSLSAYKQNSDQFVIAFIVDITHRKEIEQSMLKQQQQLEKVTNDIRKLNTELEGKVEERTIILKEALQRLEESQAELSEALDKERQLNEIKSRFVSMASHEFRTPLSSVLSSASLLAKYTTTEQQANRDRHINRIKESVKHLNDLLEDFLSLGKLDEGKIGAVFSGFNLPEAIQDTVDDMKGIVKEGQQIVYRHEGEDWVQSDKKLLRNILINLISNAVKFSETNSTIHINSAVKDSLATITVRDEGIGISQEDQNHLFSSFFRGKNALNIQGTGLGLHIVKRYADLLGGTINLQSKLGEGTTLTLQIPINTLEHGKDNSGN
jgi:PAS domain S-box-containing protein